MKHAIDAQTSTTSGRHDAGEEWKSMDKSEIEEKMRAAGTPGPQHQALDPLVGEWNVEVKCWGEPGAGPKISHGKAHAEWTLNGHFVKEEFDGEVEGQPFHGCSLMGYDNTKKKFNCVWVDDMHTSIFTSEGEGEQGNKVLTLEGTADCPVTGQKDVPMKHVFRVLGPDKHVMEMYNGAKNNAKSMEITYTRN